MVDLGLCTSLADSGRLPQGAVGGVLVVVANYGANLPARIVDTRSATRRAPFLHAGARLLAYQLFLVVSANLPNLQLAPQRAGAASAPFHAAPDDPVDTPQHEPNERPFVAI